MNDVREPRKEKIFEYNNDIQTYKPWRYSLGISCINLFHYNTPISELLLHNGLKFLEAQMKLNAESDYSHTADEKDNRAKQIEVDVHLMEEILKHDLEFRGLLIRP